MLAFALNRRAPEERETSQLASRGGNKSLAPVNASRLIVRRTAEVSSHRFEPRPQRSHVDHITLAVESPPTCRAFARTLPTFVDEEAHQQSHRR